MPNYKFIRFISYSLLAHIIIGVILIASPILSTKKYFKPPTIKTRLVKLGKNRDDKLLPRKIKPKKITQKNRIIKKSKKLVQKKKNKKNIKKINQAPKINSTQSLNARLNKILNKTEDSGHSEGSVFGESIEGDLTNTYNARIRELIKENYRIPAVLKKDELNDLEIKIALKINSDGKPVLVSVAKSSGNKLYDNAVLSGAKSINSFGAPPILLRRKYLRQGVRVILCPVKCRSSSRT